MWLKTCALKQHGETLRFFMSDLWDSQSKGNSITVKCTEGNWLLSLCPPKKFLHTQFGGGPQKYFQSGPAHAKTSTAHFEYLQENCHEFSFNLSRKTREINYLPISGYYPVSQHTNTRRVIIIDIRTNPTTDVRYFDLHYTK